MKILALDFSSWRRSVAAVEDARICGRAEDTTARETRVLHLVKTTLRAAGWEREQVEAIAVGLGPGSYTGIRLAIALAQGWQLALGTKTIGVSSAEALAAAAQEEGLRGRVNIVIDAQRNELYLATYEVDAAAWRAVESLRLASAEEVRGRAERGEVIIGPGAPACCAAGRALFPDASTIGRLAAARVDFVPGEKLEPIYLREVAFVKAPPPRVIPPLPGASPRGGDVKS